MAANQLNYVAQELGKTAGPFNIPADANFTVKFLEELPNLAPHVRGTNNFRNIEPQRWTDSAKNFEKSYLFGDTTQKYNLGLLFATKVSIPGESVSFQKAAMPGTVDTGILLGAPLLRSRNTNSTLSIDFIETNSSFSDFIIRPWILAASQYGLFARKKGPKSRHPQDMKRDLQIEWLDHEGKTRKKFNYYNCVPVSLGSAEYSYGETTNVRTCKTEWIFTDYTLNS